MKPRPTPPPIDHQAFIRMLSKRLPSVFAGIHETDRGSLYLEMGGFADATCKHIEAGQFEAVAEHLRFIDEVLETADEQVQSAVAVSYLEHLGLSGNDQNHVRARCMLSRRQLAIYHALEESWRKTGQWLKQTGKRPPGRP